MSLRIVLVILVCVILAVLESVLPFLLHLRLLPWPGGTKERSVHPPSGERLAVESHESPGQPL